MPTSIRISSKTTLLAIMLMALSLASCKQRPKPPVPQKEMEALLSDLHMAEAYSSIVATDSLSKNMFGKNKDSLARWYKEILAHHHISYKQLNDYMEWYQLHPDLLDSIYAHVQVRIDSLKAKSK